MDRLARSVIDVNDIVQQITGYPTEHTEQHPRKGASIEFLKERLTFEPGHSGPMAAFQLKMTGAFAQFERELIRQRQAEGIAAAKKRGAYKGRPRSLESDQLRSVRNAALTGTPKAQSPASTASADPRCTAISSKLSCPSKRLRGHEAEDDRTSDRAERIPPRRGVRARANGG